MQRKQKKRKAFLPTGTFTYLSDQNFCQIVGHTGQEFQLEEQVASLAYLFVTLD